MLATLYAMGRMVCVSRPLLLIAKRGLNWFLVWKCRVFTLANILLQGHKTWI